MLTHYFEKKKNDRENQIQLIEYLALMTSPNPKGVSKAISARKKHLLESKREQEHPEKRLIVVDDFGQNEFGQTVNTTFFDDLKKYGGEEALKYFDKPETITTQQEPPSSEEKENEYEDDDTKFIKEAKRMFAERELEIIEEEKFKKEHPELFDSVSF